jgi:tetratricopeptide (TPR) repeat protein
MKKVLWFVVIGAGLLTLSCSTSYDMYAQNMFHGKRLLQNQEYAEARIDFVKAAEGQRWPSAYAFAATASYKMGDLASAERYIMEAERLDGRDYSYLRTMGYKSLILLKEGKENEGMEALKRYSQVLRSVSSPMGARRVEVWSRQQPMDLPALERLIDEQVGQYESDIEQFQGSGTGFYNRPGMFRPPPSVMP